MNQPSPMESPAPDREALATGVELVRQRADEIAASAGPGWTVEVARQPPYGWVLRDPSGWSKASGSLDQIAEWLAESRRVGSATWAGEQQLRAEQRWPR
ncbi:hypothetical protein [Nocardia sp. NPDC059228]|uniref:hypothetical protein n=1 Tax=Nocardia sp. NPDC059228 TaxID=3346777 RepID=UPI0036C0D6A0